MNKKNLKINGNKWINWFSLKDNEITKLLKPFDFHELDIETCLDENQPWGIDFYTNYSFITLHFPKYDPILKRYLKNEFEIFLLKDCLITLIKYDTNHVKKLIKKYENENFDKHNEEAYKITTWFILYEIIDNMVDKMFKMISLIRKDIAILEEKIYKSENESLAKDILIHKRNLVIFKNMISPQIAIMKLISSSKKSIIKKEVSHYYEDLQDKLERIVNDVAMIQENINSFEDYFKTSINMTTNFTIKVLTIFSSFLLPLTLVTSFYWMNITLPYQDNPLFIYWLITFSLLLMFLFFIVLKVRNKF